MQLSARWFGSTIVLVLLCGSCELRRDYTREFLAFGTIVTVSAYDVEKRRFDLATDQLQQRFASIDSDWYAQSPGELRMINDAIAAGNAIEVSPELKSLIETAARYESISGGRFNICLGRLSALWGFFNLPDSPATLPDDNEIRRIINSRPSTASLRWERDTLLASNANVMLDIGGIAKGAILEIAIDLLKRQQIDNAIINLGGDLTVIGSVGGRDANIGIRSPTGQAPIAGLDVASGESVLTSGNYERFVEIDGRRYAHVFNPSTGYPVDHTASVTVVHTDPVLADVSATALLVGGAIEFDALVTAFGLDFALLIDVSGDTRLTPAMRERLHWFEGQ